MPAYRDAFGLVRGGHRHGPPGRRRRAGRPPGLRLRAGPHRGVAAPPPTAWKRPPRKGASPPRWRRRRGHPGGLAATRTSSSGPDRAPRSSRQPLGRGTRGLAQRPGGHRGPGRGRSKPEQPVGRTPVPPTRNLPFPYDVRLAFVAPTRAGPGGGQVFDPQGNPVTPGDAGREYGLITEEGHVSRCATRSAPAPSPRARSTPPATSTGSAPSSTAGPTWAWASAPRTGVRHRATTSAGSTRQTYLTMRGRGPKWHDADTGGAHEGPVLAFVEAIHQGTLTLFVLAGRWRAAPRRHLPGQEPGLPRPWRPAPERRPWRTRGPTPQEFLYVTDSLSRVWRYDGAVWAQVDHDRHPRPLVEHPGRAVGGRPGVRDQVRGRPGGHRTTGRSRCPAGTASPWSPGWRTSPPGCTSSPTTGASGRCKRTPPPSRSSGAWRPPATRATGATPRPG